jgi:hypothetical protein
LYLEPEVRRTVEAELITGVHETTRPDLFTLAYFHHPEEITAEFADAGLPGATRYAVEAGASMIAVETGWLDGDERVATLLEALRSIENEPSLFGASSHLLTVAVVA